MDIGVEISLYPLHEGYVAEIKEFIRRLQLQQHALRIVTNSMSTQVFGPYDTVMDVLRSELGATLQAVGDRAGTIHIWTTSP